MQMLGEAYSGIRRQFVRAYWIALLCATFLTKKSNCDGELQRIIQKLISNSQGIPESLVVKGNPNVCTYTYQTKTRYYYRCGIWGWSRCTGYRTKTNNIQHCCTGWSPYHNDYTSCRNAICASKMSVTGACTQTYNNDYIKYRSGVVQRVSGGSCTAPETCTNCNDGFYSDGPKCTICPAIANCLHRRCSSPSNNICEYCDGDVKSKQYWRAYTSVPNAKKTCEKACSWRSDSTRCFPGTCSDETAASCKCIAGFSGTHCETMTEKASIIFNEAKLKDPANNVLTAPGNLQSSDPQDPIWTNNPLWKQVDTVWNSKYTISGVAPSVGGEHYVTYFDYGIKSAVERIVHKRGSTLKTMLKNCPGPSEKFPQKSLSCTSKFVFSDNSVSLPFVHDDQLLFQMDVVLGGYGKYVDRENNNREKQWKLVGTTKSVEHVFHFDMVKPYHCLNCEDLLNAPNLINETSVQLTWGTGWADALAGLSHFQYDLYLLGHDTMQLGEFKGVGKKVYTSSKLSNITKSDNFEIPDSTPGMYAIHFIVYDKAGNFRVARKVFLFDNLSVVDKMNGKSTICSTASVESQREWVVQDTNTVTMEWTNRFKNIRHLDARWLNAVAAYTGMAPAYDDLTGTRTVKAINNVQAIVDFQIKYEIYESKTTKKSSQDPKSVRDIQLQSEDTTVVWADGDKMDIRVYAIDVLGIYNYDDVTIYRDATPPIIENLWLTRGDRLNVSVHRIEDFQLMTIEWLAYDYHSGLDSLYWKLYDNYTDNVVLHGKEDLSKQHGGDDLATCQAKFGSYPRGHNCYCSPFMGCYHRHFQVKPKIKGDAGNINGLAVGKDKGVHESDYYIEVMVKNKAQLTTVLIKKITIDISPPHTGVVHDGIRGSPEVDYQQSTTLNANWEGFFDRESGVLLYMYGYDTKCINKADFVLDSSDKRLHETYSLHATHTAPGAGTYYISVVAFNRALEPSDVVCSDGVTVDTTVPKVKEVTITPSKIRGGLIKDTNNYYVVGENRIRKLISNPTADCVSKARELADADMFPVEKYPNDTMIPVDGSIFCGNTSAAPAQLGPTLSRSSMLYLEWIPVTIPAGVHDYEVGLSATKNSPSPEILAFSSSKQHAHFHIMHADVPDATQFYIIIKTISKANVEGIQSIGPCFMDTTEPTFSGQISVNYSNSYVAAYWASDSFNDPEDSYDLDLTFAIGHEPLGTDVHGYQPLQGGDQCVISSPPTCTAIKVDKTDWYLHGHHVYYFTIKAENSAGLTAYAVSEAYTHDIMLPSKGRVYDVNPEVSSLNQLIDIEDIDFQESTSSISATWMAFAHQHLEVTYDISIGSISGGADILANKNVGSATSHTETGLSLTPFKTYYVTITAKSSAGNVHVSSDGVTIVTPNHVLTGIVVNDGDNCTMEADSKFTHHTEDNRMGCAEDIEIQASVNSLRAYWSIPSKYKKYTPDAHFAIEEKSPVGSVWALFREYEHVSKHTFAVVNNLVLNSGRTYRFSIKLCAITTCFTPVTSNGVLVLANPPVTGTMQVTHLNATDGAGGKEQLVVNMARFYDPDVKGSVEKYSVIEKYEWAITDQSEEGRTHTKWEKVTNITLTKSNTWMTFTITLEGEFDFTKCRGFAVRGMNKAKLKSKVFAQVKDCKAFDPILIVPNYIIDVVGESTSLDGISNPVILLKNALWPTPDKDYTPNKNYLSAVWPRLRYNSYVVAVIKATALEANTYYKPTKTLNLPKPCDHPNAIACAKTDKEYHNFKFDVGRLTHGTRYLICLHANKTEIPHEKWTQVLPDLNTCSDGITTDFTPPVAGDVWITDIPGTAFQTSTSNMYVNWHSFRDVEESSTIVHSTGIQDYRLGLGTTPGGNDMVAFHSVGVVNHVALHGLKLQSGHTYYATVIGKDFANRVTSKTSKAVVVDTTPPMTRDVQIAINKRHIVSKTNLEACWMNLFVDVESGIDYYEWAIGSEPGYDDILEFTKVVDECGSNNPNNPLNLKEGHAYFISVKAYNKAGLMSVATSWAYVVDTTPPDPGHVYDGRSSNPAGRKDIDFQTDMSALHAFWEGFYDSHTAIKEYYVSIGTCSGCMDVLDNQAVGIVYELSLTEVHFGPGLTYYTTVKACNTADMCTSVTSDGVIIDDSPPSMGLVFDGAYARDIEYQSIRTYIGAKWYGFADPQSGLDRYEWRVGTTVGGDDIIKAVHTHLSQVAAKANLNSTNQLPVGTRMYITVRAYNKAGLYTDSTSDGFIIDDSAPKITKQPTFSKSFSQSGKTQYFRNAIKVEWQVSDAESFIERQYLSIKSHLGGEFNLASTRVNGISRDFVLTGLKLHDGSTYYAQLISCNGAEICTTATSAGILVDSTPPSRGMFAISTDHAVDHELNRAKDGFMTWSIFSIKLAWLGFADLHSQIDHYNVYVGSSFLASDLNKDPGVTQVKSHDTTGDDKYDEGRIQTFTVETVSLTDHKNFFITVFAVNKVGLSSAMIHSQFERITGGTLALVRRCVALTCEGKCVCAAQDRLCSLPTNLPCKDQTQGNPNNLLSVADVQEGDSDNDYTASDTVLQGAWSIVHRQGNPPLWYEWSVGLASSAKPEGIFDIAKEKYWFEVGDMRAIFITKRGGVQLQNDVKYSFFVRVWYAFDKYAIFKSNGVQIATNPPSSTKKRGKAVTERMFGSNMKDQDYVKQGFPFIVDWDEKFLDASKAISSFRVYISTCPGGHDAFDGETAIPGSTTSFNIKRSGDLKAGVKYYSNVVGYGLSGMHHTESSDGFTPEKALPNAGIVFDGVGIHDLEFQNASDVVEARWHGFTDVASGIVSYYWCVGLTVAISECNVLPWENVGVHVSVSRKLSKSLAHNTKIYSKVYAVDAIGLRSVVAISDGVTIDLTVPEPQYLLHMGANLLQNPSFETSNKAVLTNSINVTNTCNLTSEYYPNDWEPVTNSCVATVTTTTSLAYNGRNFVFVRGGFTQTVSNLEAGELYRLNFYSSHIFMSSSVISNKEGYAKFGDKKHVFLIYSKAYRKDDLDSSDRQLVSWHRHTFYFEATESVMNLTLGSGDAKTGVFYDDVVLEHVDRNISQIAPQTERVPVHVVYLHTWGSIHSSWTFVEDVSNIVEYFWAIGYSKGGIQLQDFTSTGTNVFAYNKDVTLVHNSYIYVTVIARNTAGKQAITYSDAILVDLTAPDIKGVYDGRVAGDDQTASTDNEVAVNWQVEDPESGLEYCEWAIGYQSNGIELQVFTKVPAGETMVYRDFDYSALISKTVYCTIRCKNKAGLISFKSSNGIRISNVAPSITNAVIKVMPQSLTEYQAQTNYQSNTTDIRLTWSGFKDDIGIDLYQISVKGKDVKISEKTPFPPGQDVKYTDIINLNMAQDTKKISIKAINPLLLVSDPLKTDLNVFVEKPTKDNSKSVSVTWEVSRKMFTVSWDGIFSSPHPIYYEVSAGKKKGGGEIVQWMETKSSNVTFELPKAIVNFYGLDVFVYVRAIAAGGLYEDVHGTIKLPLSS